MVQEMNNALVDAVCETLENMAFMEAFQADVPLPLEGSDVLTVSLLIHDPQPGELWMTIPRPLLLKVAEGVFALPSEDLGDQILRDLLAEILNTLAGRFLTRLLPPLQSYRLGLPDFEESVLASHCSEKTFTFRMLDGAFVVGIRGEPLLQL